MTDPQVIEVPDALVSSHTKNGDDAGRAWIAGLPAQVTDPLDHWDLHYDNVLAAEREPWLVIDPEPFVGDPGFDLWPALDTGWEGVRADAVPRLVRRRFDLLTEALGLDRERAVGWTLARLLQNTLWDVEDGRTTIDPSQTTVAEALSRR